MRAIMRGDFIAEALAAQGCPFSDLHAEDILSKPHRVEPMTVKAGNLPRLSCSLHA
jgi:hypothetical protein